MKIRIDTHYELVEENGKQRLLVLPASIKRYIEARLEGMSDKEAKELTRVTARDLNAAKKRGDIALYFRERMQEAGLGDDRTIELMREGLESKRYVTVVDKSLHGDARDEESKSVVVVDHASRLAYLRTKLELEGYIGKSVKEDGDTEKVATVNFIQNNNLSVSDPQQILDDMVARARAVRQNEVYKSESVEAEYKEEKDGK